MRNSRWRGLSFRMQVWELYVRIHAEPGRMVKRRSRRISYEQEARGRVRNLRGKGSSQASLLWFSQASKQAVSHALLHPKELQPTHGLLHPIVLGCTEHNAPHSCTDTAPPNRTLWATEIHPRCVGRRVEPAKGAVKLSRLGR